MRPAVLDELTRLGSGVLTCVRGGATTDVGASQLLINGKIKLKNDSRIRRFTKTGFEFEDGSTVDADVVMFATGCVLPTPPPPPRVPQRLPRLMNRAASTRRW